MGRPKKQTVDYFPHDCRHGKTMFILEQKHGNDGYAFWFKLLEMLGDTEGHFIDCNNPATWEFLQSKTRLPDDICVELLNLLSKLDAIDAELWQNRIIWSENFIKGISEAYRNRRVDIPIRPDIYCKKSRQDDISTPEKPHRKEKKRKVEKRILESHTIHFFSCPFFSIDEAYHKQLLNDYPGLSPEMLLEEIKKAADWLTDNPNRHKKRANGNIANPRLFLRNWLKNVTVPAQTKRTFTKDDEVEEWKKRTLAS